MLTPLRVSLELGHRQAKKRSSTRGATPPKGVLSGRSCLAHVTIRLRRSGHAVSDVKTSVGRLIVRRLLPGDLHAVSWVVHQRVDAAFCHIRCRVNTQGRVVALAYN